MTIYPLTVDGIRRGATAVIIRVVIHTEYDDSTNYYGPYATADALTVAEAIESRHPDYEVYVETLICHNPLVSGITNR